MLQKFNLMNVLQHFPTILLPYLPLATRAAFWFHNPIDVRKKFCVVNASKNVPSVAAALYVSRKLTQDSAGQNEIYEHLVSKLIVLYMSVIFFDFKVNLD